MLTVGSLFSGIGGIDLGLERAGMKVLWQCEQNEYARKVLRKHWPDVACYEDIKHVRGPCLCRTVERCDGWSSVSILDVLAGGFPCQDISVAGKGAGIKEGTRSGLWSEFARLVRELRPRYVLVENVPALRSRGLDRVLGDLASCGYNAEWDCFPASDFGAPFERERMFVIAVANGKLGEARLWSDKEHDRQGPIFTPRYRSDPKTDRAFWMATEPDVGRMADGIPARVDRLRCLGNAVVPIVAEYVGRLIVAHAERNK